MRVKEESEKAGLKLNIQKTNKIMASGPITLWQLEGEKVEAVTNFIFLGSRITVDGDYSHDFKRCLPLGRKAMTNLDSVIKKQRHPFASKGLYRQSYGSSISNVRMWELDHEEGWAPKNWCFQIVVLEKTLKSPLDCKEIKSVNPKGNNPEYSLGGLMLKLQYFAHVTQRVYSLEKTLMLEKIESKRSRGSRRWDG